MTTSHHNTIAIFMAIAGFSLYCFNDVIQKITGDIYNPAQVAFFIQAAALITLICVSWKFGGLIRPFRSSNLKWLLVRSAVITPIMYLVTTGFVTLGMTKTYTLIFMAPFFTTILATIFMNEKIHIHRISAIIAGFAGVLVVLRPGLIAMEPAALGVLFAALCFSASSLLIRRIGPKEPMFNLMFFNSVWLVIAYGAFMAWKGYAFLPAPEHVPYFLSSTLFLFSGNYCMFKAFSLGEPSSVAPFHYIQLLWGTLFGYVLFGQGIDLWTAAGGAIIVVSGLYMIYRERLRHKALTKGVASAGTLPE